MFVLCDLHIGISSAQRCKLWITSDGSRSKIFEQGRVNFLWPGLGRVSHSWFGFGKFHLKASNFSIVLPSGQVRKYGSGRVKAHLYELCLLKENPDLRFRIQSLAEPTVFQLQIIKKSTRRPQSGFIAICSHHWQGSNKSVDCTSYGLSNL